jgi:hypothetical protein
MLGVGYQISTAKECDYAGIIQRSDLDVQTKFHPL